MSFSMVEDGDNPDPVIAKLQFRPAESLRDFMVVRRIRNSCREFMTREQGHISYVDQLLFFVKYHILEKMRLMYIGEDKYYRPVAYGLISYDEHLMPWVSGGVLPSLRGKGYGSQLFKFLSSEWHMPVYLEVLESNKRALKLYTSLGFQEIDRKMTSRITKDKLAHTEVVITMRKDK